MSKKILWEIVKALLFDRRQERGDRKNEGREKGGGDCAFNWGADFNIHVQCVCK